MNSLHHLADDATGHAERLLDHGQRLARRGHKHARRRLHAIADFAEDAGDRAALQARRLRRQVERHPVATAGITLAAVGVVVLAWCGWRQYRASRQVPAPDHDYFADSDEDREAP
ncbi:MAG TPA: hypothetical protein VFJ04_02945 [Rhodanobacteraceae bacterium]|jgi:hypothetical protein|nr:hypothetical protein [Rhodanobacteraceae bacterium]